MTAAFALHLHGDYHLVCVGCFCWEICWMAAIEWRLDGGSDVMIWVDTAIMKWRFGSVKERGAIRRGSFGKKWTEFWRRDFWGNIVGSSVEGSLAVLVIFRCVWRIVELPLQKNRGESRRGSKKPRELSDFFWWTCWKRRLYLRGCICAVNKIHEFSFSLNCISVEV